jgi:hypothetical protein
VLVYLGEGVIHDWPRPSLTLQHNSGRGKLQMPLVGNGFEGENRPVPHLDVIIHVGEKEQGVVICG